VTIKSGVADRWIKAGAKPSETVRKLIKRAEAAPVSA
jgi:ribosomal protein S16